MVVSLLPADMHWETKAKFFGQVKPAGIEKSMNWKTGFVHFDYDTGSGSWMAKLYFQVNPTKACHQIKIGQTSNLDVKCGRLMIENQKGDGIHIKLSNNDVTNAKMLISKIKSSKLATPTHNRAEVGLVSSSALSSHKGSENVSPARVKDSDDLSLFQTNGDISPECHSGIWSSKNTPPMKNREQNPTPKRRLELFSPEREKSRNSGMEEEKLGSTTSFTGIMDYSKRNLHGGNSLSVTRGLWARSFYGAQNSLANSSECRDISKNSRGLDRSPAAKRPKLSSSLNCRSNRMDESNVSDSSLRSTASKEADDSPVSLRHGADVQRKHFRAGETVGFQNLGNTCFLNSPLQCLSSLEPLSLDIQSAVAAYGMELNPNSMTRKLYLLMRDVRKNDACPEHVKDILIRLRTDMNLKFAPNTQQDAHEFLSEVLNRLDEEVKAAMRLHVSARPVQPTQDAAGMVTAGQAEDQSASQGGSDPAAPLLSPNSISTPTETNFCWSYRTDIYFHECKTQVLSSQTEREMTLMLAFDASTKSLQECINKYFESTDVEMKCEKCGREEKATITRKIVRRPRVFILNLLRYHSDNMESSKKADTICVPSYISISGLCADDVKRPPCVDPVFMLDRDVNLGLRSIDNVDSCRCDLENSPRRGPTTPPLRSRLNQSVFDCQDAGLSNLTPDSDELNTMISEMADLDHLVPDFEDPKDIYGKVLAYPNERSKPDLMSHRGEGRINQSILPGKFTHAELETPMDFSQNTLARNTYTDSFIDKIYLGNSSSLAEDDPQMRTSRSPLQTQKYLGSSLQTQKYLGSSGTSDHDTYSSPRSKTDTGRTDRSSHQRGERGEMSDPTLQGYELSIIADFICFSLRSVEKYIADAQDRGDHIGELHDCAQNVVSELNEDLLSKVDHDSFSPGAGQSQDKSFSGNRYQHETALSIALLKRALNLHDSRWVLVLKDSFRQIIEDVILSRYDQIKNREKCVDYLIEDLGLYIAAMQLRLLPSVKHEQEVIADSLKTISEKLMARSPAGSSCDELGLKDDQHESYIPHGSVHFKKAVARKKVHFIHNELDDNEYNEEVSMKQGLGESYSKPVIVESLWKQQDWGEGSSQQSSDSTSSRTRYVYGRGASGSEHSPSLSLSGQSIHGKDISLFSEAELQRVDYLSLTEDEMMVYAQALSRFEYQKEQTAQVECVCPDIDSVCPDIDVNVCPDIGSVCPDIDVNVCPDVEVIAGPDIIVMDTISPPNSEDSSEDTSEKIIDLTGDSENCPQKAQNSSSEDVDVEDDAGGIVSPIQLNMSSERTVFPRSLDLICEEDMSVLDEIDGAVHVSEPVHIMQGSSNPHLISSWDSPLPSKCKSSNSQYTPEGSVDQTSFEPELQTASLFPDLLPKSKTSKTSPGQARSEGLPEPLAVSINIDDTTASVLSSVRSPIKRTAKDSVDKNGDSASHSSSKKEYLFSPTKTNILVKTRDYARLKSPGVSPKKRVAKGQQSKSVTKWLHFSGEDKTGKSRKTSPDGDESLSGEDGSGSEMLNMSLEVNIDDMSFLDNINNSSLANPALAIRHSTLSSTPKSKTSAADSSKCVDTDLAHPARSEQTGVCPLSSPPLAEESSVQQLPHTYPLPDMQVDSPARAKKTVASEKVEPENSSGSRVKVSRTVAHAEEKENMPEDQARCSHVQNIEMGKADLSYKLVGVVDHTGTSQFTGHYTAYAFNMKKQKWFHLNDSETEMVTEEQVQANNTQTGYLFFYMDKDLFNEYTDKADGGPSYVRSPS